MHVLHNLQVSYANKLPLCTYTRLITPALYTTISCMVVTIGVNAWLTSDTNFCRASQSVLRSSSRQVRQPPITMHEGSKMRGRAKLENITQQTPQGHLHPPPTHARIEYCMPA